MPDNYKEIDFNNIIKNKIFPGHKKEEINFGHITSSDSTTFRDYEKDGYKYTNPVKAFHSGKLGLYGLQGNASEWEQTLIIKQEVFIIKPIANCAPKIKEDKTKSTSFCPLWLPDQDSNLDSQNQNLKYYHYTIGQ